jgi:hypothetical protein
MTIPFTTWSNSAVIARSPKRHTSASPAGAGARRLQHGAQPGRAEGPLPSEVGAISMGGSSVIVVVNAASLKRLKLPGRQDRNGSTVRSEPRSCSSGW